MTITNKMLANLKSNVAELAAMLGMTMETAFDAAVMPEWLWTEMAAARDAAGPRPEMSMDLLAPESPEREAVAKAVFERARMAVVSPLSVAIVDALKSDGMTADELNDIIDANEWIDEGHHAVAFLAKHGHVVMVDQTLCLTYTGLAMVGVHVSSEA